MGYQQGTGLYKLSMDLSLGISSKHILKDGAIMVAWDKKKSRKGEF